jgi:hypothetical protein
MRRGTRDAPLRGLPSGDIAIFDREHRRLTARLDWIDCIPGIIEQGPHGRAPKEHATRYEHHT